MSYNTGVNNKVNGGVAGGEFLSGKMDFFTITTSNLFDQTNVETRVEDLYQISSTVWSPVTVVDGHGTSHTYSTKADYITAWKKQQNVNILVNVFSQRANPVIVSIPSSGAINFATEKTGLWFVNDGVGNYGNAATDTNYTGYMLEDAIAEALFWQASDDVVTGHPTVAFTISSISRQTFL